MKKLTAVILLLIMVLALAACGITKPAAKNEITDLLDQGYECRGWTADETMWRGMFLKGDSYDEILKVTAPMTEKQYEEFNGYFDDEDADAKQMAFLGTLTGVEVTDISDMVPAQEELDAYVGKTLGDMEADSFENTGWMKPGHINIYNICMMEELCSIFAFGAGGSSKIIENGKITRKVNPKYPLEYIKKYV